MPDAVRPPSAERGHGAAKTRGVLTLARVPRALHINTSAVRAEPVDSVSVPHGKQEAGWTVRLNERWSVIWSLTGGQW